MYGNFNTECIGVANGSASIGADNADNNPAAGASDNLADNLNDDADGGADDDAEDGLDDADDPAGGAVNGEPTRPDKDPDGGAFARGFDNDPDDNTDDGACDMPCDLYITSLPPPIVAVSGATAALLLPLTLVSLTSDAPPTLALVFLDAGTLPKFSLSLSGKKTDRGL